MVKRWSVMLAAMLSSVLLAAPAPAAPPILGIPNTEDLIALPGDRWVAASSLPGPGRPSGALYLIDARDGRFRQVYPARVPAAKATVAGCPGEVPAAKFSPHGLTLSSDGGTLYAVNHGTRESIEMFRIGGGETPVLRWAGCTIVPAGWEQNSIAAAADGTLFSTVMPTPVDYTKADKAVGKVIAWPRGKGWRDVPGSAMGSPNGILAAPDGRTLWVNSYAGREIVELKQGGAGAARRSIKVDFMPDNLRRGADGTIYVAGARATLPELFACATGKAPGCKVRSMAGAIDPASFTLRCVREVPLSFVTVAAPVGREVWAGTVRGATILRLPAAQFAAQCG